MTDIKIKARSNPPAKPRRTSNIKDIFLFLSVNCVIKEIEFNSPPSAPLRIPSPFSFFIRETGPVRTDVLSKEYEKNNFFINSTITHLNSHTVTLKCCHTVTESHCYTVTEFPSKKGKDNASCKKLKSLLCPTEMNMKRIF